MIGIIDYGASNLLSVKKALDYLGARNKNVSREDDMEDIEKIILPGVGAFERAIQNLRSGGLYQRLRKWIEDNNPFLGICLGMQLLFEESEESEGSGGLGIFKGKVVQFKNQKIPQIGWNRVRIERASQLVAGIPTDSYFYFLHGYYVEAEVKSLLIGTTEYGVVYPSIIERGNISAVQFHPEKSGDLGLEFLKNWVNSCWQKE